MVLPGGLAELVYRVRDALLRRLAWSLGIQGRPVAWIDDATSASAVRSELSLSQTDPDLLVLIDDADALDAANRSELERARSGGARLVLVGGAWLDDGVSNFRVPELDQQAAIDLVRRAVPSLSPSLQKRVVEVSGGATLFTLSERARRSSSRPEAP